MARWNVLVSAPYFQPVIEQYRSVFEEHDIQLIVPPVHERLSEEELLAYMPGVHGVICGDDRFTEHVLGKCVELKVISKWGTGIDSIDSAAAKARGIAVCNTPNAFTDGVADTAVGYILNFARQLSMMDHGMKRGGWEKRMSRTLRESTVGIVGLGNIGRAVASRLVPFGPRLIGSDVVAPSADFLAATSLTLCSVDEVIAQSDFVTLHCFLDAASTHLMNAERFASMKVGAYLVNTARGPLVDEVALVDALQTGTIAGAALDVFEVEPLPEESPLRQMENVLLAPHNSNASPTAWQHIHETTLANLLDGLQRYA